MPSLSLRHWREVRLAALDELEAAHASVGGTGPGRRVATQQINHAYAVLLSSHFQGFCRDLHSESAVYLVQGIAPAPLQIACRQSLVQGRKLDQGNPNPGNLGSDFNRLGLELWPELNNLDRRNVRRQTHLETLNKWRNAIAHQDFDPQKLGARTLVLDKVRQWRRACNQLACAIDEVMRQHIEFINGSSPW